jgi:hypothetical protein
MGLITSALGSLIGTLIPQRSYWAVKLENGKWLCELDTRIDSIHPTGRPYDWTLDLIDTSDIRRVKELWLFCPPTRAHPLGQTAHLEITEPGTAFQFKTANVDVMGAWQRQRVAQVIGRVNDKLTGDCECFIWDQSLKQLLPYRSSIYRFGSWQPGIAPIGALSLDVMGLKLS